MNYGAYTTEYSAAVRKQETDQTCQLKTSKSKQAAECTLVCSALHSAFLPAT